MRAVISTPFLEQMKSRGMRIREYRLAPGERVACTIRADDDAVVGRMQVTLAGVKRVDVLESLDLGRWAGAALAGGGRAFRSG